MYDGKTQLLIKNPIDRYLINAPMSPNMKMNADGLLTLYIQNKIRWPGSRVELAARPRRPNLSGHASLLAEGNSALHPPSGKGTCQPPGVILAAN
jgi:hypothetical protein